MSKTIIGISGSPIENSNTDRAIKSIMDASGLESEFVKLSDINVRPCMACKKCMNDNTCVEDDDFPELAKKILAADAIVIGAYTPYSQIDGFTKALLERLWSTKHMNNLLGGKACATVVASLIPEVMQSVNNALKKEMVDLENMNLVGQVSLQGNIPCAFCGKGDDCETSAMPMLKAIMKNENLKASDIPYTDSHNNEELLAQLQDIGKKLAAAVG